MKRVGTILAACLSLSILSAGQEAPPKPGPEQKKLDVFAGSWTMDGDIKAGINGPGGKLSETEKCEWMEGGFFLICHTDFKSAAMGNGSGLAIMGYSAEDKAYTYREFDSFGDFEDAKGAVDGDTWTWTSDEKMGGTTSKGRFSMKITSPTAYTVMFELSSDGTMWNTVMEGKATKAK